MKTIIKTEKHKVTTTAAIFAGQNWSIDVKTDDILVFSIRKSIFLVSICCKCVCLYVCDMYVTHSVYHDQIIVPHVFTGILTVIFVVATAVIIKTVIVSLVSFTPSYCVIVTIVVMTVTITIASTVVIIFTIIITLVVAVRFTAAVCVIVINYVECAISAAVVAVAS